MKTISKLFDFGGLTARALFVPLFILITMLSCSSDDQLEVQSNFPFEVELMPVPKEISLGQTVEIRISIQQSGDYENTEYYLRYFQFDGEGTLQYFDDPPYQPNDLYPLSEEEFRLYYTSTSSVTQSFDIWISDNFENEEKVSFQFNNKD